jgi:ribosome-associated protein
MSAIPITHRINLDESELEFRFVRASGPGGQNVNKVSSAVQLRFDAGRSPSLPEDVRARLLRLAGGRATSEGVILIDARTHRQQWRNRQEAVGRLVDLIRAAVTPRAPRIPTRPGAAAQQRRLSEKRVQGERKQARRRPAGED